MFTESDVNTTKTVYYQGLTYHDGDYPELADFAVHCEWPMLEKAK
jgi:hypothetical protein